ncbi:hypothetical protein OAA89_02485 [bacterium]|nr:hypothetical protein [Porticoccaceae bacterium]MDB4308450.1 hypothetical protein [Porticoccaceae bacterium]MDB9724734.1 hypothetical protein [bacterium]MDB9814712.1 hypothetical protein [bacterium]MDC0003745.1 hypothetical protein [Porticoccaceae bacterium]
MKKDTQTPKSSPLNTRKSRRRVHVDRREEIRFEPSTDNRRQNTGRRVGDKDIWKALD